MLALVVKTMKMTKVLKRMMISKLVKLIIIIMTTTMMIKSMKGCVELFLGGIIEVWIRTSNYLNDKDTLASLYYDNDNDVYDNDNECDSNYDGNDN